jgi:molecular chaperone HscA
MDAALRNLLVRNLLERLDADALAERAQFTSVVTADERNALHCLYDAVLEESRQEEIDAATPVEDQRAAQSVKQPPLTPRKTPSLVLTSLEEHGDKDTVVCFDFGTAKSKAFAGAVSDEEDPDPQMFELGLGQADNDPDGAVYSVHSSVWISNDGLMFAGGDALRQSAAALTNGPQRRRLDSIKQELSLSNAERDLASRLLDRDVNPSPEPLTYEDALCFYLGYLTDITGQELQNRHGLSKYTRRRFTLPAWQASQRSWATRTLHSCLKRAQVLADTFAGKWASGIPVADFKAVVEETRQYSSQLNHLFDGTVSDGALLEPLAAGSGRVWADRNARNLMLVLDVGAGTTDFSLFWIVQNPTTNLRRAFSVFPSSNAIRMADTRRESLPPFRVFQCR